MFTYPLTNIWFCTKLELMELEQHHNQTPDVIDISPNEHPDNKAYVERHSMFYHWLPINDANTSNTENFLQAVSYLIQYENSMFHTVLLCEGNEPYGHAVVEAFLYLKLGKRFEDKQLGKPENIATLCASSQLPSLPNLEPLLQKTQEQCRLNMQLYKACKGFSHEETRKLLKKGADPNYIWRGNSVLHTVLYGEWFMHVYYRPGEFPSKEELEQEREMQEKWRLEVAQILVDNGADVNRYGSLERPPISYVTDGRIYDFLIAHGADPNEIEYEEDDIETLRRKAIVYAYNRSIERNQNKQ
ncbi:MAG: hypothetical protein E7074_07305 [Bacteroidales bacterium]|nr:hypothetical protein [Bacteroidales bacterium]